MFMHPVKPWILTTNLTTDMRYRTKVSPCNHGVPLAESQYHVIDPTNFCRTLHDCIKNRLYISRRTADDAEDLGCCRLVFQGFAQFRVALLDLFEETDVFDGDNRLISEGFKKSDLFVGERANFRAANQNGPDRYPLAQQRCGKVRPCAVFSGIGL